MVGTPIRYHIPLLGHLSAHLRDESDSVYRALLSVGEVERLKNLDHLGLMRAAWEGAHHSRWEYTVVILSLIEKCRAIPQIHLSGPVTIRKQVISSGYELLRMWALLLNTGHLVWTFAAERALLLEVWEGGPSRRDAFLSSFGLPTTKAFVSETLADGNAYRVFQALAFVRLSTLLDDPRLQTNDLYRDVLDAYVSRSRSDQTARLKRLYRNLRRVAYLALDTHYTPSVVTVDLSQVLSDDETFARLALRDLARETDELDSLGSYLNRETYLGRRVVAEIAAREGGLRSVVRTSLRTDGVPSTVEALASGELQRRVQPIPASPILRITGDSAGGLAEYWPGRGNARTEQAKLNRDLPQRSRACALYWRTASGNEWVLQSHTLEDNPSAIAQAFGIVWQRATDAQRRARLNLESEHWADLFSDRLASEIVLQALPLFFGSSRRWEWGARGVWGEAVLAPRSGARWILERAMTDDIAASRRDELEMLRRSLRGRPSSYAAVSLAPLIAYEGGLQVAELDGCFLEFVNDALQFTLIEAKRMGRGPAASAERSLGRALGRLLPRGSASSTVVRSESVAGGLARAWATLRIGSGGAS